MFSLFRRRRERESAMPAGESAAGEVSFGDPSQVVGQQVAGAQPAGLADGLAALSALGPMIQQTMAAQGSVEAAQQPSQTLDLRGSGLREEIVEIMREHGIDAESGAVGQVDASAMPQMQQQILEALGKHGVDLGAIGGAGIQIQSGDDDPR